jgi:Ala-tRNA(Pro) deacylase
MLLSSTGSEYEVHEHEPVYTCKQMAEYLKIDEDLVAKSLVLKKCFGTGYLLAVLPGRMKLDFTRVAKAADTGKVILAPIKDVEKIAGCSIGAVFPLGNLLNLRTFFDPNLLRHEYVFFNPGSHTKSVRMKTRSLVELVRPTIAELGTANISC